LLRRPMFWTALAGLTLLLLGLLVIALPDSASGQVVWELSANHGFRSADVMGSMLLGAGSLLTWLMFLVWQWQVKH